MTSAIAVTLKTESGDNYTFAGLSSDIDAFHERIADSMGDELEYVWSQDVDVFPWDEELYKSVSKNINEARGNV